MKKNMTIIIFIAITIIIQSLSTFINIGGFPISLCMIPIIIGGAIYGVKFGGLLGLIFGIIVSLTVVLGLDPTGTIMFSIHPVITIGICIIKGIIAGLLSSIVFKLIQNKKIAIIFSSITATVVNTFLFVLVLILFFEKDFSMILSTFLSINFIVELLVNTIVAPSCFPIINSKIKNCN